MLNNMELKMADNLKPIIMEINPELWQEAKIQAIRENINLRDFVARAIRNELNKLGVSQ